MGWLNGSGSGSLKEGDYIRGFTFNCSCFGKIKDRSYPAKWKKPESRLEVFGKDIGTTKKCELNVAMADLVYLVKDGRIIELTKDQWNKIQSGKEPQ